MRQRERVLRIAAETAEKMGLDPRNKEAIDSIVIKDPSDKSFSLNEKVEIKEHKNQELPLQEEQASSQEDQLLPPKKKNPFPPKKKKSTEIDETAVTKTTVE